MKSSCCYAQRDRSGRSAWPELAPGLTPDSIKQKYPQTVVPTRIVPGCVQVFGEGKTFLHSLGQKATWRDPRAATASVRCDCYLGQRQAKTAAVVNRCERLANPG